jgi:PTH1 family peptidyl-tRNA hydrolase
MSHPALPIRLIVGLGNPGDKYAATRHNAGFWFADRVARRFGGSWSAERRFSGELARVSVNGHEIRLLKPHTYMNRSGESAGPCLRYFRFEPSEMLVVHDELDLDPGVVRLKFGGGHGGHNGLRDMHRVVGSEYWRLRVGIGHPGHKSQVTGYVLNRADADSESAILGAIDRAVAELGDIAGGRMQAAMNRLHAG